MSFLGERLRMLARWQLGWMAVFASLALTWIGIQAIATADAASRPPTYFADRQTLWLVVSMVVFAVCLVPQPRNVGRFAVLVFTGTLVLLLLVLMPFAPRGLVPVINGARSWINLHVMSVQPSELAKLSTVLALAWYLRHRQSYRSVRGLIVPFGIVLVPMMLVLMQPDLGTAILFGPALLAMLVAAGAKLRHLGTVLVLAAVAIVINVAIIFTLPDSMQVLKSHQRTRIMAMISRAKDDHRYDKSANYQQVKAMTLVGSGRLEGYGQTRSATILHFNHLPHDHHDMIFAVIVNRWGAAGGAAVLALCLTIVLSILGVASRTRDPFMRLALVGFAAILFTQAAINVAIPMGLLPVTGITLPFVSYGGTSLVATFAMLGLVVNFASQRPLPLARSSFEYDQSGVFRLGATS